jgi:hypothetical protein
VVRHLEHLCLAEVLRAIKHKDTVRANCVLDKELGLVLVNREVGDQHSGTGLLSQALDQSENLVIVGCLFHFALADELLKIEEPLVGSLSESGSELIGALGSDHKAHLGQHDLANFVPNLKGVATSIDLAHLSELVVPVKNSLNFVAVELLSCHLLLFVLLKCSDLSVPVVGVECAEQAAKALIPRRVDAEDGVDLADLLLEERSLTDIARESRNEVVLGKTVTVKNKIGRAV